MNTSHGVRVGGRDGRGSTDLIWIWLEEFVSAPLVFLPPLEPGDTHHMPLPCFRLFGKAASSLHV